MMSIENKYLNCLSSIEDLFFKGNDDFNCLSLIEQHLIAIKNNKSSINLKDLTKKDSGKINSKKTNEVNNKYYTRLTFIIASLIQRTRIDSKEFSDIATRLTGLKCILSPIFDASSFENTDYFLYSLLRNNIKDLNNNKHNLYLSKISVLYCLSSEINVSKIFELFENHNNQLIRFGLALLSESFVGTENAAKNKDWLLTNLPSKINKLNNLNAIGHDFLPLNLSYMYCSYSELNSRHKIKESIHSFLRRCETSKDLSGISNKFMKEKDLDLIQKDRKKILVIHEQFTSNHSMYRCFRSLLLILKDNYFLIGLCFLESHIDDKSKELFDKHISLNSGNITKKLSNLSQIITNENPDIIYYPSIGMSFLTILTSSYRLARTQIDTYGHPAPTLNQTTDLVIEHKGVKKTELDPFTRYHFLPYAQPSFLNSPEIRPKENWNIISDKKSSRGERVTIAIAGMPFKITYSFISIIKILSQKYRNKIQFIILEAYGSDIINDQMRKIFETEIESPFLLIKKQNFTTYLKLLSQSTIFLSPYPFGGHSGFLDCIRSGLIGPCLSKSTFPQNIERKFYDLVGFESLVSKSKIEYIEIASDLINFSNGSSNTSKFVPKNMISPAQAVELLTSAKNNYKKEIKNAFSLSLSNK
tara:strand:+ start:4244 stop:6175 length:1932 start_codon:yes stop_codon:yes gene_type:complete